MKKGPKRKAQKPPPARARGRAEPSEPRFLQYKVVELSTVDEGSLERTLNEWSSKGWSLDGVQFAMRDSSRRPSMAFVLFTRESQAEPERDAHDERAARDRLARLAEGAAPDLSEAPAPAVSPYERLAQLAGLDDPEDGE